MESRRRTNSTHLSYADDVLKEITKPRTVPRTVSSELETNIFTLVCVLTRTTTVTIPVIGRDRLERIGTRTSGHKREEKAFGPNVVDDSRLKFSCCPSTAEEGIRGDHSTSPVYPLNKPEVRK